MQRPFTTQPEFFVTSAGLYLRQSLGQTPINPERAIAHVMRTVALELEQGLAI